MQPKEVMPADQLSPELYMGRTMCVELTHTYSIAQTLAHLSVCWKFASCYGDQVLG